MVDYCYIAFLTNNLFILKQGKVLDKAFDFENEAYYNVDIDGDTYIIKDKHIFFSLDDCLSYISLANRD